MIRARLLGGLVFFRRSDSPRQPRIGQRLLVLLVLFGIGGRVADRVTIGHDCRLVEIWVEYIFRQGGSAQMNVLIKLGLFLMCVRVQAKYIALVRLGELPLVRLVMHCLPRALVDYLTCWTQPIGRIGIGVGAVLPVIQHRPTMEKTTLYSCAYCGCGEIISNVEIFLIHRSPLFAMLNITTTEFIAPVVNPVRDFLWPLSQPTPWIAPPPGDPTISKRAKPRKEERRSPI